MVLDFRLSLEKALEQIGFRSDRNNHHSYDIWPEEVRREWEFGDAVSQRYCAVLHDIVDRANSSLGDRAPKPFKVIGSDDELASFFREAGSNSHNYSQFRAPSSMELWTGKQGLVVGIHQRGRGFDAINVNKLKIQSNSGGGFDLYRKTESSIFFDNPRAATAVYMCMVMRS